MPGFSTGVATQVGLRHRAQQDGVAIAPRAGLWAVVDGMGGHGGGEVASRLVTEALLALPPAADGAGVLGAVQRQLRAVHQRLNGLAGGSGLAPGAAFVVLLAAADHYGVVWAGDARLYLRRQGVLMQLTRDHAAADGRLLRAIGGGGPLEPETARGLLRAGDRFLLCSDGVTRVLGAARIAAALGAGGTQAAADALIAEVLAAGAPDDATGVVVEFR